MVRERLLTPVGLRSLAPGHPDYKPKYYGDLRSRDAAYHQGTVWAWLIGPFVDAWLQGPSRTIAPGARGFLEGFVPHLGEACIGSISEIFDAEPPFTPRGCIAQAWSVAEVLRCWVKTGPRRRLMGFELGPPRQNRPRPPWGFRATLGLCATFKKAGGTKGWRRKSPVFASLRKAYPLRATRARDTGPLLAGT